MEMQYITEKEILVAAVSVIIAVAIIIFTEVKRNIKNRNGNKD